MQDDECPGSCSLNETDMFTPLGRQIELERGYFQFISPKNDIGDDSPLLFEVKGISDEFIDMNNMMLRLRLRLLASDGTHLKETDVIAPVNNWFHSIFSDVQLEIGTSKIEGGSSLYPYKAYLYNLLVMNKGAKESHLVTSAWFKDTATKMESVHTENDGFKARKTLIAGSKIIELCGPLLLDVALQNRYLLPNIGLTFTLVRSKPTFHTMIRTEAGVQGRTTDIKVEITSAKLEVRRVKCMPSLAMEITRKLDLQNAIIPVQHTKVVTFTMSEGTASHTLTNIFTGKVPKAFFMGFVENTAYNGSYTHNPFNFKHYGVSRVEVTANNDQPCYALEPDFESGFYAREYQLLLQALGLFNKSEDIDITMSDYGGGYTIFGFNFTPNLTIGGMTQPIHSGTVNVNLQFKAPLPHVVSVICMGIFDGNISIDSVGSAQTDY